MLVSTGDVSDVPEPEEHSPTTSHNERLEMNDIIHDIKSLLETHEDASDQLMNYLEKVEQRIEEKNQEVLENVDRLQIKRLIERHPYFKNPSQYHIRLITIMKYLRKKGIDVRIPDIDLLVDEIIQTIDGVKKTGYGQYIRKRH